MILKITEVANQPEWKLLFMGSFLGSLEDFSPILNKAHIPTLLDNPGVSRMQDESPGLPYG